MKIYAYVPGQDRSWIRRCDVLGGGHQHLLDALQALGIELHGRCGWEAGPPSMWDVPADDASVALDWLDERGDLPPALGERLRRETRVERWLLYRSGRLPRDLLVQKLHGWTWRETFRPYLQAVLKQLEGQDRKHQDQALREAYPPGVGGSNPPHVWLDEIRVQRGEKPPPKVSNVQVRQEHPDQALLFGGAP